MAIVLLFFGILTINQGQLLAIVGVSMLSVGIYMIIKFCKTQCDGAVDSFCNNKANEYYATKRIIVESQDSSIIDAIYFRRYCFENIFGARQALRGKDNIWRSSILEMSCVFLTEDLMYYFCKKISLITEEKSENEKVFRLQDIQMVSLEEINQSIVALVVHRTAFLTIRLSVQVLLIKKQLAKRLAVSFMRITGLEPA